MSLKAQRFSSDSSKSVYFLNDYPSWSLPTYYLPIPFLYKTGYPKKALVHQRQPTQQKNVPLSPLMISLEAKRYLFIYLFIYLDRTHRWTGPVLCDRSLHALQCHPNTWKYKCLVRDGNNRYYISCELGTINRIIRCNTWTHMFNALVCCQPKCP